MLRSLLRASLQQVLHITQAWVTGLIWPPICCHLPGIYQNLHEFLVDVCTAW